MIWEIAHPDLAFTVGFGGHTESFQSEAGRLRTRWFPNWVVNGVAYEHADDRVSFPQLRSCDYGAKAEAVESFDFAAYNSGDYERAVHDKIASENISKVLYPNDEGIGGNGYGLNNNISSFLAHCKI